MGQIFKTWKQGTYFKGGFQLGDRSIEWSTPIKFPIVFRVCYDSAVKSGNWRSCTGINTPNYVIDFYFDTIGHEENHTMHLLWKYCKQLVEKNWDDVENDKANVLELIRLANYELGKLDTVE